MKKAVVFLGAFVLGTLVSSCEPDEIEKNTTKQGVDIEKRANDSGDKGSTTDIPRSAKK